MDSARDLLGVDRLHGAILDAWNRQDAAGYADHFCENGVVVGFDGSEMTGRSTIAEGLATVFGDHEVATYVRVVRGVDRLGTDAALLRAVVGMVPPGGDDVMEDRHAVQLLTASWDGRSWRAQSLQNTPAQLHGRPEAVDSLTEELRTVLHHGSAQAPPAG